MYRTLDISTYPHHSDILITSWRWDDVSGDLISEKYHYRPTKATLKRLRRLMRSPEHYRITIDASVHRHDDGDSMQVTLSNR